MKHFLPSSLLFVAFALSAAPGNLTNCCKASINLTGNPAHDKRDFGDTTKWQLISINQLSQGKGIKRAQTLTMTGRDASSGFHLYLINDNAFMTVLSLLNKTDTLYGKRHRDTLFQKMAANRLHTFILTQQ